MAFETTDLYNGIQIYERGGDSVSHEEGDNPQATWKVFIVVMRNQKLSRIILILNIDTGTILLQLDFKEFFAFFSCA